MGTTREDGALLVAKTTKILLGCHHFRQESPLEVDPPGEKYTIQQANHQHDGDLTCNKIHHRHKTLHRSPLPGATLYRILNNVIPSPAHINSLKKNIVKEKGNLEICWTIFGVYLILGPSGWDCRPFPEHVQMHVEAETSFFTCLTLTPLATTLLIINTSGG